MVWFPISIYGLERGERDKAGTLHFTVLKELKSAVGVFLEAESRHCEIKINCGRRCLQLEIPVLARRARVPGNGV